MLIFLVFLLLCLRFGRVFYARARALGAASGLHNSIFSIELFCLDQRLSYWLLFLLFTFTFVLIVFLFLFFIRILCCCGCCSRNCGRLWKIIFIVILVFIICFFAAYTSIFSLEFFFLICFLRDDLLSNVLIIHVGRLIGLIRLHKPRFNSLLLRGPYLHFLSGARVTQGPIRLENISLLAINTFSWLSERLVLLVINLPLDLIVAALAKEVKRCLVDPLRKLAIWINREFFDVLVLLASLLLIRHRHGALFFFIILF